MSETKVGAEIEHAPIRHETKIGADDAGTLACKLLYRVVCRCGWQAMYYQTKSEAALSWLSHATRELDAVTLKPVRVQPLPKGKAMLLIASYM